MIPPNEFKKYICEECSKAFITYSLEVGSHLECSLPDRIFVNGKDNDLRSSCPQFRDEPNMVINYITPSESRRKIKWKCESCKHHAYDYLPLTNSHLLFCRILAGRSCGGIAGDYPKYEQEEFIEEEEMVVV